MENFLKEYFHNYINLLKLNNELIQKLLKLRSLAIECSQNQGTIFLLGNGGSAATSSHIAVDLSKNAKVKAMTFNDADLITCFSNDFGYDKWMKEALKNLFK